MDVTKLSGIRDALVREHERLVAEIDDLESSDRDTLSDSSGENNYRDALPDLGSATFAREIDFTLEDEAREHLAQVDRALKRIDEGTYGTCTRCGDTIPRTRLEAMPEAELCVPCKEWEESR